MGECQGLHWGNTLPGPSYSDQETGAGRDQEDAALVVGAGRDQEDAALVVGAGNGREVVVGSGREVVRSGQEVVRSGLEVVRSGQEVVVGNAQVRVYISLQGVDPARAGIV